MAYRTSTALAFLLLASCASLAGDIATFGSTNTFIAPNCLVTKVDASSERLYIEFRGRWESDALLAVFPDTYQNGLIVLKGETNRWAGVVELAELALDRKVTLKIKSYGWMMRGGILVFTVPPATLEIISAGSP